MAKFSQEQVAQMREWVGHVHSISEFQSKLNETFGMHLTYLETRFLMDDLDLQIASDADVKSAPSEVSQAVQEVIPENTGSTVRVDVDPVTRPGMVFNGSVTFSDGQKAAWSLDQLGRIGLKPDQAGYRPSQEDVVAFQEELQQQLSELSKRNSLGL